MMKNTWEVESEAAYIRAEDMLFVRMGRESSIPKYQAKTPFFAFEDDDDEYDLRRKRERETAIEQRRRKRDRRRSATGSVDPRRVLLVRRLVSLSLDLRQNNLTAVTGKTLAEGSLLNQGPTAFSGNPYLCGFPFAKKAKWRPLAISLSCKALLLGSDRVS
nr:receptor protein kinase-like protein ZAR1 [Ipomoea batatas]